MISLEKCRETLGDSAKNYSVDQIQEIRSQLYCLAEICIKGYIEKAKKEKLNKSNQ